MGLTELGRNLSRRLTGGEQQAEELMTHRHVFVGDEAESKAHLDREPWRPGPPHTGPGMQTNEVITSQYTALNFLFLNLWKQFKRPANVYFLFICCLQCIRAVSITNGIPTTLLPLLFVLAVTALKDAVEDYNRHRADDLENNRVTHVVTKAEVHHARAIPWREVKVGDVVLIKNRELIPADMVLIASSEATGLAFVMTANLDGETNLKAKEVHKDFRPIPDRDRMDGAEIVADLPNNNLEHFEGTYTLSSDHKVPLTARNVLLRGCMLRNTEWALGAVVYTGKESKIQMNAVEAAQKIGSVRRFTDRMTVQVFSLQVLCCIIFGVVASVYVGTPQARGMWYMWRGDAATPPSQAYTGFLMFWSCFLLFTVFVPISLLVTLDMVKFLQGVMMMWDLNMYHETLDVEGEAVEMPMLARSTDLNEELGLVSHVFSDKTGTLTCNVMEFLKCTIGEHSYGLGLTQIGRAWRERNGLEIVEPPPRDPDEPRTPYVNINCPKLKAVMADPAHEEHQAARDFWQALALNHDVMPEMHGDKLIYSGSSPDETSLVWAAKHHGFGFKAREPGKVTVEIDGKDVDFKVLHVLEFTSDRKKSSVILRREDNSLVLFCKGADNIIKSRLSATLNTPQSLAQIDEHVMGYVNDGLRTLLLAKAELKESEYKAWAKRYQEAETSIKNRDEKRWALMDEIEKELQFVGITAIEDKLQDGVPETIYNLRQAGIKVWMLTGDKVETAVNIAYSCSLVAVGMKILRLCGDDGEMAVDREKVPLKESIEAALGALIAKEVGDGDGAGGSKDGPEKALVVDTYALAAILKYELQGLMLKLCDACVGVVCARVSPKQKAKVVEMVKVADPTVQTLSIGDGANDVPMLQSAHIGVGVCGLEGQQAVNNSDYAIGQFRFLANLLLEHGRFNYRRTATVVKYVFYKNALLVLPQFFFGIYSAFSGQNFYSDVYYQLYNVVYTAFPIIAYGIMDKDVPRAVALSTPALYRDGLEQAFLTTTSFWGWMLEGICHAVLVTFIPIYAFGFFNFVPGGESLSLWDMGTIVFLLVMTVASLRVAQEVVDWQWIITALLLASFAVWWLSWVALNWWLALAPSVFGSLPKLAASGQFWMTYLCATVACFVLSFALESVSVLFRPRRNQIVREQLSLGGGGAAAAGDDGKGGGANDANGRSAVVVPEQVEVDVEMGGKAGSLRGATMQK